MSEARFIPRFQELVEASPPHPAGACYRVGIGPEDWDGTRVEVEKIQMVYAGKVAGRKAPSYPAGTDDAERVGQALTRLRKRARSERRSSAPGVTERRPLTLVDLIGSAKGLYGTPEEIQEARDELRREWV